MTDGRPSDKRLSRSVASAELYLRGFTYSQIAEKLGVSRSTVCEDVKLARAEWKRRCSESIAAMLHQEVAKLDQVEASAWTGWERSLRDAVQTTTEDNENDDRCESKLKIVRVPQAGNPVFLKVVADCIKQRCELMGLLDPDTRNEMTQSEYDEVVSVVIETREEAKRLQPMTLEEFEQAKENARRDDETVELLE